MRNVIRNRRTGEESTQFINSSVVPQSMFNKPVSSVDQYAKFLNALDFYVEKIKAQNPKLPRDKNGNTQLDYAHKAIIKDLSTFADFKNLGTIIYKLTAIQDQKNKGKKLTAEERADEISLSNQLNQIFLRLKTKTSDESYAITSFVKSIGQGVASAFLDNILPGSSLVLPIALTFLATPGAAQDITCPSDNWVMNSGRPEGGANMCASFSGPENFCKQGYLTCDDQPWNSNFPQYSFGTEVSSGNLLGDAGASIELDKCISADKVGLEVKNIMISAGNSTITADPLVPCGVTLPKWKDFQTTVTAKLPTAQCASFSAVGSTIAQGCENNAKAIGYDWAIAGGVMGGILLCACICGGAYYCLVSGACEDTKCCSNPC